MGQFIQKAFEGVFNGLIQNHSNNMMFKSFAEYFSKPSKKSSKMITGSKNFTLELLFLKLHVKNTVVKTHKFLWIYLCLLEI